MPFSFLVRPRPDQVRAARLDAETADRDAAVVGGASRAVAMELARQGVALEAAAPTPVKVRADAAWIRQALTVFVLRAIDRGSSVAMSAIPKGSLVRFDVADRGPDIDAGALDM